MVDETSLHAVYIVNEDGMRKIFADLKETLVSQNDVTLIYFSSENNFIFDRELTILQQRHLSQFILYKLKERLIDASSSLQELLEAIINSNTKDKLIFTVSGDEELIHIVTHRLWFLDVSKDQIKVC